MYISDSMQSILQFSCIEFHHVTVFLLHMSLLPELILHSSVFLRVEIAWLESNIICSNMVFKQSTKWSQCVCCGFQMPCFELLHSLRYVWCYTTNKTLLDTHRLSTVISSCTMTLQSLFLSLIRIKKITFVLKETEQCFKYNNTLTILTTKMHIRSLPFYQILYI